MHETLTLIPLPTLTALPYAMLTLQSLYLHLRSKRLIWESAQFYQEEDA